MELKFGPINPKFMKTSENNATNVMRFGPKMIVTIVRTSEETVKPMIAKCEITRCPRRSTIRELVKFAKESAPAMMAKQ